MTDQSITEIAAQAAHEVLVWVGFGTLVGLAAKAVMPGRDPGGAVATLMMGIAGSVVGCGAMTFFASDQRVTPISLMGFLLATAGAFVLLFFHRLLAGSLFQEGQDRNLARWWPLRRRRRRVLVQELE
ncbi:MAG: GlsB/YeaQ/YmgE family stress response membrane protein [Planctomycetaceae bacterium]|nr:GlsB/YeaQ/YmgE family stress response membrane protein [Planctomycetaceae bacterium]